MQHVLDNPAWNALISGNKHLANGNGEVKYFDREVSPFVGFRDYSTENFQLLLDLLPHQREVRMITTPIETEIPAQWKVLREIKGLQMVYDIEKAPVEPELELTLLTDAHVPQMLALTKLTNPGPFDLRTIEFGQYYGVFDGDKLVAMTGQRMHVFNYAEVSAVCTHPDYTGKGYARQLLIHHVNRIKAASEIPFLHVRYNNDRAIKVYESIGFYTRQEVYFYLMVKAE